MHEFHSRMSNNSKAGKSRRSVKQPFNHFAHLLNPVFNILLGVLGKGHVAVSAKEKATKIMYHLSLEVA